MALSSKATLVLHGDVIPSAHPSWPSFITNLHRQFAGTVVQYQAGIKLSDEVCIVYLAGVITEEATDFWAEFDTAPVCVIEDLAKGDLHTFKRVTIGQVPIEIPNVGVFFPRLFDDPDMFEHVEQAHEFQQLTESNKPNHAHRTGLYLSQIQQLSGQRVEFNLMRCSSNFSGPTEGFADVDEAIMAALNTESQRHFADSAEINHVLAQIYHNKEAEPGKKQSKAGISSHSDKTKDMHANGLLAFCSFYTVIHQFVSNNGFDYEHAGVSRLPVLRFKGKGLIYGDSPPIVDIPLYPGSVLIISLDVNRTQTHAIVPSRLQPNMIPTRMGYVARCSRVKAVSQAGTTFVRTVAEELTELHKPTHADMRWLKDKYYQVNVTGDVIDYGTTPVLFSMNEGDYECPIPPRQAVVLSER
eukprot:TRINITY_DN24415_c0_g1_i1.p1 TRINITY_DN24415_c0_g1~~TRINITY_DN24415_c0_g1_i1.p1  ORF type:complete len:420 (+),score=77.19 TRINITY_DN24415_c0_g1_i1:24-1262(+)